MEIEIKRLESEAARQKIHLYFSFLSEAAECLPFAVQLQQLASVGYRRLTIFDCF